MTNGPLLHWLPVRRDWRESVRGFIGGAKPGWHELVALATSRLDLTATNMLDTVLAAGFETPPVEAVGMPLRLAVLGSSTLAHLSGGLRVAALRRSMHLSVFTGDFGQYRQELADTCSALHAFAPTAVLFAFDAQHLTAGMRPDMTEDEAEQVLEGTLSELASCWEQARHAFGCLVLQQTGLPRLEPLLGNAEHLLPGSPATALRRLNAALRSRAAAAGVHLVALDERAAVDGLGAWHDRGLWLRGKQEVSPRAAPMYGELVVRVLAALAGRSAKCLVLDLDNTLWGGVVGDDGLHGLVLGQGSADGEAFAAIQSYAKDLSRRGIALAVCSKNDERNALEAFERHPEMTLRRSDIACFVANWADKATNLRAIAAELNIGLDALVFLDDNPAERALIRQELPAVAVPELPEEPAGYTRALTDGGYFESVGLTREDLERSGQYQANQLRKDALGVSTDLPGFLRGLEMTLSWSAFEAASLPRITQLINKTNQFNLTTRRRTADEVAALVGDDSYVTLRLRLLDRFGDNGIVAIVIGRLVADELEIDTWLMSCRVLGREVEVATLEVLCAEAARRGARSIKGVYVPSPKNGMVRDHYGTLGFETETPQPSGLCVARLDLAGAPPRRTSVITIVRENEHG